MIIGFGTGAALAYLVIINVLLSALIGDTFRTSINIIYHTIKPFMYGSVALAVALSPNDYNRILPQRLRLWHERQVNVRLKHLRSILQTIAPSSMSSEIPASNIHLVRDILDAREMILSNIPPTHSIREQAQYIARLALSKCKITEYGPHAATTFPDDALTYSLAMSYYVQKYHSRLWQRIVAIAQIQTKLEVLIQAKLRLSKGS
jgi:hypothetical protein